MRIGELVDFIMGTQPDFHAPDAAVAPGDKFGRYEERAGWTYVEVSAFNDGQLRPGCVYAKAFSRRYPAGRDGYCHLSQLGLRIDEEAWAALRAEGWPALGVALGIGTEQTPAPPPLDG
jgi:hypothetical protein